MALSWEPSRSGERYCAPACGFGCTWVAHERAQAAARELAHGLGEGWEPRVWENLGWHYSAQTTDGRVKVHTHGGESYTAFVSPDPSPGGRWTGRGSTPREALAEALEKVQEDADGIAVALRALKGVT